MRLLLPYPPLQLPRLTRWGAAVALSEFPQLSIANVDRSLNFDRHSLRIVDDYQHQPNTATLEVFGFTPALGDRVVVRSVGTDGNYNQKEFSGQITRRTKKFDRLNDRLVWRLTCIDGTYEASGVLITAAYGSQSASVTAHSLMASAPSGFGTAFIEAGLPTVAAIQFKMTPLPDALTQLCDAFGGGWYFDEDNALHLFTTDSSDTPDTIDSTTSVGVRAFRWEEHIEAVVNRILVEGGGSRALEACAVGETILPVEDTAFYSASGGQLIAALNVLTYTGLNAGGAGSRVGPDLIPTADLHAVSFPAGGQTAGYYGSAFTFVTASGETVPGPRTVWHSAGGFGVSWENLTAGPSGVTGRKYYRTPVQATPAAAQSATLQLLATISDNTTTTYTDTASDAGLGAGAPSTGSSNLAETNGQIAAGATSILMLSASAFSASGGWAVTDQQVIRYTGKSGTTLTGVPASGIGAITAPIPYSAAITTAPVLTGVPSSGTGSVRTAISKGTDINILAQVDDTSSQALYGVRQKYIQDRRLSIDGAATRGDAELTIAKDPRITGSFVAEDVKLRSGRPITISMASEWGVDDTYTITRVEKYFEENRPTLQRRVEFSSASIDRNLFEVLRRIQGSIREAA